MKKNLLVGILLIMSFTLFAQNDAGVPMNFNSFNNGSAYLYSGTLTETEQLKIKTYIWGQVRKPGLYIVPDNTDLLTLISLAGGPTEDAKLTKVKIVRPTTKGKKVILVNLKKYMENGDSKMIPILKPGDTVILSVTVYYAFRKGAQFLSNVAIVISVYTALKNLK
jgi:polysaccharide export outer membrane protein